MARKSNMRVPPEKFGVGHGLVKQRANYASVMKEGCSD